MKSALRKRLILIGGLIAASLAFTLTALGPPIGGEPIRVPHALLSDAGATPVAPLTHTHPYFIRQGNETHFEGEEPRVWVDSQAVPDRITVPISGRFEAIQNEGPPGIEFVLILPGDVSVADAKFEVEEPFFIAAHELSYRQAATLSDEYQPFPMDEDDNSELHSYAQVGDLPAIGADLSVAAELTGNLSLRRDQTFRLPSVGEWYLAMKGGKNTSFWWGESIDRKFMNWQPVESRTTSKSKLWKLLCRNQQGESNPYGLANMIGNASELSYPTAAERDIIRGLVSHSEMRIAPSYVLAHSCFLLGGSVDTRALFTAVKDEWDDERAMHSAIYDWEKLILWQQIHEPNDHKLAERMAGIRLVLELPPGSVTFSKEQ